MLIKVKYEWSKLGGECIEGGNVKLSKIINKKFLKRKSRYRHTSYNDIVNINNDIVKILDMFNGRGCGFIIILQDMNSIYIS